MNLKDRNRWCPVAGKRRDTTYRCLTELFLGRQSGSITAELAVVLPAVLILLAAVLLASSAGILQLRLEEGARAGARSLARGETTTQAVATAQQITGNDVVFRVEPDGEFVTFVATGKVSGALAGLVPWEQSAKATARKESMPVSGGGNRGFS